MTFKETAEGGTYNPSDRTVTWNVEKPAAQTLTLTVDFDKLPEGEYERELPIKFTATCDGSEETFESNVVTVKVASAQFSLSQTSNISDGYLSANEEITYAITVKNLGKIAPTVTFTDNLPKELSLVKAYYMLDGKEVSATKKNGDNVDFLLSIETGKSITIYVKAKAMEVPENIQVTNKISLSSDEIGKIEGNSITHTLIGKNGTGGSGNNPGGESGNNPGGLTGEFRLSGTAWIDNNKNGIREEGENLLAGLKVYLLNSTTREILSTAITNDNGGYVFLNLTSGNYVVVFEYDTNKYELTTYQINGADESINSDAINMDLTLNGTSKKYAATNTINLSNNTYNVDIGLIDSPKFDLELEKTITLVQVSNSAGTKTYTFNNTDSAQVQIPEKQIKGSAVAITYEIKVTNTGAVPGYANKIVDYKAKDLNFSSTLNPEWYEGADGALYTGELAGKLINPGETHTVSIILTKTMTSENMGLSNNSAEIAESSNDKGLQDVDSTPGNRSTAEDDYGTADIIIAVKTGGILFFGGILLIVLAIFAFGIYEINKRVLRKI